MGRKVLGERGEKEGHTELKGPVGLPGGQRSLKLDMAQDKALPLPPPEPSCLLLLFPLSSPPTWPSLPLLPYFPLLLPLSTLLVT